MVNEKRESIFIGIPCYREVAPEVLEDWMRFAYHCGRRMPQYDFYLGIKTKAEQFRARNAIVEAAMQVGADWTLMLDDDMIINPFVTVSQTDDYGFIERLIAHNKDICGVLYYQRGGGCLPVMMTSIGASGYRFMRDDEITGRLQKVDVAGGGCLLIKTKVFDRLKFPYFAPEHKWGTDIQLCRQAADKGIDVWVDTGIEFGHLKNEKVIITRQNRGHFQMTDTMPGEVKRSFVSADVYDRLMQDVLEYTKKEDPDAVYREADSFLALRKMYDMPDADWYRQFPMERVCRQVWFNTASLHKRQMTEFILKSVNDERPLDILDFGCGIGIPAFFMAERGHKVTALDVRGTGTLEFLKWRCKKYGVHINFVESDGGVPQLNGYKYDVIVAMDSIEHIAEWREVVKELGSRIKPKGIFFSNNGILDDKLHPEHYDLDNKEFIAACMAADLMPINQITFMKKEVAISA